MPVSEQTRDPYVILGVAKDATLAEVQQSFRLLQTLWHPEAWVTKPKAQRDFAARSLEDVLWANDKVGDARSRAAWDREAAARAASSSPPPPRADGTGPSRSDDTGGARPRPEAEQRHHAQPPPPPPYGRPRPPAGKAGQRGPAQYGYRAPAGPTATRGPATTGRSWPPTWALVLGALFLVMPVTSEVLNRIHYSSFNVLWSLVAGAAFVVVLRHVGRRRADQGW